MTSTALISCPIELRVHPDVAQIEADAQQWAVRVGLADPASTQLGWLGAACHPDGDTDRVKVATNLLQWIFAFDDFVDHPGGTVASATRQALLSVRVVEEPGHRIDTSREPVLAALDDIGRRLRTITSPAQYERFVAGLTEWVLGEVCGSLTGSVTEQVDYDTVRRYNTNGMLCYGLIDAVTGVELPEARWREPRIRALTRIASDVMGYTNDVVSYPKEAHEPASMNLVSVFAREHGISLDEAAVLTARHLDALYTSFHDLASQLRRTATPALDSYLRGLEAWVCGQHHWSLLTDRYRPGGTSWPRTPASSSSPPTRRGSPRTGMRLPT